MGCLGVGFLSPRESLLYKNKIILHDDEEEILSKSSLEKILPDQPNRRFLGLPLSPYVYLYHWGKQGFSTQKTTRKIQELEEKSSAIRFDIIAIQKEPGKTRILHIEDAF